MSSPDAALGSEVQLWCVPALPLVRPGDDLGALIGDALARSQHGLIAGDVLIVAQKIVSKAENRYVDLAHVEPGAEAKRLAQIVRKDARLVEVILGESVRIVRAVPDILVVEHRLGLVMANAGVDQSNLGPWDGLEPVLLLPHDPDESARQLRAQMQRRFGCPMAVIINDSFGRPWRQGTVGVAIGVAGLQALVDLRGRADLSGRMLRVSEVAVADEIAAAASLLMGQAQEGRPVVLMRGLQPPEHEGGVRALLRPAQQDLFR
ncbi:MAG: coenzyme F420-0:L-glutamate ligase [Steroidobacteraceae bacterium]